MFRFYLMGALLTFSMMMFIFLRTKPWAEDDGQQYDRSVTHGAILACLLIILFLSLFSWVAATFLLAKRLDEIKNGID